MESDLAAFLARHDSPVDEMATWANGAIRLRIAGYLGNERPPEPYVTSVRALVFRGDEIMVVRDPNVLHIIPGGRREEGETIEGTLSREIIEETGWAINKTSIIGFMHCHHLSPRPPDYRFPYPDFIHLVHVAEAVGFVPQSKALDDYELESTFRPVAEVQQLELTAYEHLFLRAALKLRAALEE